MNFHPTTQKSKSFTSMGSFCSKYISFELKEYREVIFHDTNSNGKFEQTLTLRFQKWQKELGELSLEYSKVVQNCILIGSFCPKHIIFQLEKFRGITLKSEVLSGDFQQACGKMQG